MNKIIQGDCIEQMKLLEDNSVDAIITDPPYGLEFMGKEWDYGVPGEIFFKEMIRVLKPGGFLLSFGGTRTYHRLVCGIEDAGFEIRDTIMWLYGSGFPKSLNIGKQIDKMQGNEREEYIEKRNGGGIKKKQSYEGGFEVNSGERLASKGNSEWEGWGTALKPACEPIVVARKPLSEKNVALNVLKWGTGGINIDECRIGTTDNLNGGGYSSNTDKMVNEVYGEYNKMGDTYKQPTGRFPANIILDEEAGKILDEQSGELSQCGGEKKTTHNKGMFGIGTPGRIYREKTHGASRFFYCAKASKSERNLGCEELEDKRAGSLEFRNRESEKGQFEGEPQYAKNNHPTVKPIKLMEYLIKLVSREGAVVLDPFAGSGTTLIACEKLNRKWIGIEKEEEYIKIINARLKPFMEQTKIGSDIQSNEQTSSSI